jgi:hypothetical protein
MGPLTRKNIAGSEQGGYDLRNKKAASFARLALEDPS